MSQKIKQTVIAVVIIIIAFFGFRYWFGGSSSTSSSLLVDNTSGKTFVDGQAILALLNRLNQVTLNDAIFSNPAFIGLISFDKPIKDEIPGRINPFAPIGVER